MCLSAALPSLWGDPASFSWSTCFSAWPVSSPTHVGWLCLLPLRVSRLLVSLFAKPNTCFSDIFFWILSCGKKYEISKSYVCQNHGLNKFFLITFLIQKIAPWCLILLDQYSHPQAWSQQTLIIPVPLHAIHDYLPTPVEHGLHARNCCLLCKH